MDVALSGGLDRGSRLWSVVGIRDAEDIRSGLRKGDRVALPQAPLGAGDDREFAVEPERIENACHVLLLYQQISAGARLSMSSKAWFSPAMPQMKV